MALSSQRLEMKTQSEEIENVTSDAFDKIVPQEVADIVFQYAFSPEWLKKQFLFSGIDSTPRQILFLAEHAGPLDQFEYYVRSYAKNLKLGQKNVLLDETWTVNGMQGTLVQLLIIGLDLTIKKNDGTEIDEGAVERFIKLVTELWPDRLPDVLKQAQVAAPLESETAKQERESTNLAALNHVFDAIKQDDEKITQQGIEAFHEFVKTMKQRLLNDKGCLTDNRYYLNLIHLIYRAFVVLVRRREELSINEEDCDGWSATKTDHFRFKIIGAALQLGLPSRVRQILKSGLYDLFVDNKKAERVVDASGDLFRGVGSDCLLGVNAYYDDTAGLAGVVHVAGFSMHADLRFQTYYTQLHQHLNFMDESSSHVESDNRPFIQL